MNEVQRRVVAGATAEMLGRRAGADCSGGQTDLCCRRRTLRTGWLASTWEQAGLTGNWPTSLARTPTRARRDEWQVSSHKSTCRINGTKTISTPISGVPAPKQREVLWYRSTGQGLCDRLKYALSVRRKRPVMPCAVSRPRVGRGGRGSRCRSLGVAAAAHSGPLARRALFVVPGLGSGAG